MGNETKKYDSNSDDLKLTKEVARFALVAFISIFYVGYIGLSKAIDLNSKDSESVGEVQGVADSVSVDVVSYRDNTSEEIATIQVNNKNVGDFAASLELRLDSEVELGVLDLKFSYDDTLLIQDVYCNPDFKCFEVVLDSGILQLKAHIDPYSDNNLQHGIYEIAKIYYVPGSGGELTHLDSAVYKMNSVKSILNTDAGYLAVGASPESRSVESN